MAKSTRGTYGPDAPIFKTGPQVFVPASRPSTDSSPADTDGTKAPLPEEQKQQQAMAEKMAAGLASLRNKDSTTSPEPSSPQSPTVPSIPSKGDQLLRNLQRRTTPMVNECDPLPVSELQSKHERLESNKESLKLLDEIMLREEQKNPELAAKQARLLQILAKSGQQPGDMTPPGPADSPRMSWAILLEVHAKIPSE